MKSRSKPKRRSPVKKFMDKFHKPRTHRDKSKYRRRGKHQKDDEQETT